MKKTNAGSGSVLVCDCDTYLKMVLDTFIIKLQLDRIMLMEMFLKFDADGKTCPLTKRRALIVPNTCRSLA